MDEFFVLNSCKLLSTLVPNSVFNKCIFRVRQCNFYLSSTNESDRAESISKLIQCSSCSFHYFRMRGESKVVVGAEVQHLKTCQVKGILVCEITLIERKLKGGLYHYLDSDCPSGFCNLSFIQKGAQANLLCACGNSVMRCHSSGDNSLLLKSS